MLGIKRTLALEKDGTVASCHNTMVPFVDGMANAFIESLPKKESKSSMPPKATFSKIDKIADGEDKTVLIARYMCLIGMLLWACRHCFPECRVGCSFLSYLQVSLIDVNSHSAYENALVLHLFPDCIPCKIVLFCLVVCLFVFL